MMVQVVRRGGMVCGRGGAGACRRLGLAGRGFMRVEGLCGKRDLFDRLGGTDGYAAVDSDHLGENIKDRLG